MNNAELAELFKQVLERVSAGGAGVASSGAGLQQIGLNGQGRFGRRSAPVMVGNHGVEVDSSRPVQVIGYRVPDGLSIRGNLAGSGATVFCTGCYVISKAGRVIDTQSFSVGLIDANAQTLVPAATDGRVHTLQFLNCYNSNASTQTVTIDQSDNAILVKQLVPTTETLCWQNGLWTVTFRGVPIPVSAGGTGLATLAAGSMLYGAGTNPMVALPIGAAGRALISDGTAPTWVSLTGYITDAMLANMGARSVKGRSANSSGVPADISFASARGKFLGDRGEVLGAYYPTQTLSKSSNYSLVQDDYGALVICTAALTVTLPAPGTVGNGWWCTIKKRVAAGSDVTVARNASETIDGRSVSDTLKADYATVTYMTDGTNWHVVQAEDSVSTTLTSAGTFTTGSDFYQNLTSLSVPAGLWVVDTVAQIITSASGGGDCGTEISTSNATGNSSANETYGDKACFDTATASRTTTTSLPGVRFSLTAASTTLYVNSRLQYGGGTNQYRAYIRAKRVK